MTEPTRRARGFTCRALLGASAGVVWSWRMLTKMVGDTYPLSWLALRWRDRVKWTRGRTIASTRLGETQAVILDPIGGMGADA